MDNGSKEVEEELMAVEDFLEGLEGLQIEELEEDEVKAGLHLLVTYYSVSMKILSAWGGTIILYLKILILTQCSPTARV